MDITPIRLEDRDEFLEMSKAFYRTDAVAEEIPASYRERTFGELMRSDCYASCYMARSEDHVMGYMLLAQTFSQEAGGMVFWVEELYVKPKYRNQGIAKAFLLFLQNVAMVRHARLRLEVKADNNHAIRLYRKLGFSPLDYAQMMVDLEE